MEIQRITKEKRLPYIEVEGVENWHLDAALLLSVDEDTLISMLSKESKIIKKSGIIPVELKLNKYSYMELVTMTSLHLLENYTFYNLLANKWKNNFESFFKDIVNDDSSTIAIENLGELIMQRVEHESLSVSMAINVFRFCNNGEYKEFIPPLLETHSMSYYNELGIQTNGLDIDVDSAESTSIHNESGELDVAELQDNEKNLEEKLRIASKLLLNVADQLNQFEDTEELKSLLTSEKEKNLDLLSKLEVALHEVKGMKTQNKAILKENKALLKNVTTLTSQLEQAKKDSSKLSISLGESRNENITLSKDIDSLEKKLAIAQKNQTNAEKKGNKEATDQYELKLKEIRDTHQKEVESIEQELAVSKKQAEENSQSSYIEEMKKEIELLKKDMHIIEKERNELLEKIQKKKLSIETLEDFKEINDEEIEFFVEFDNKPTRN